jgi:hypothetical protein
VEEEPVELRKEEPKEEPVFKIDDSVAESVASARSNIEAML